MNNPFLENRFFLPLLLFAGPFFLFTDRIFDPVTLPRYIFVTAILILAILHIILQKEFIPIPTNGFTGLWAFFVLITAISLFKSGNLPDGVFEFSKTVLGMVLILVLYAWHQSKRLSFKEISFLLTFASFIQSFICFIQILTDYNIYGSSEGHLGSLTHPNQLSAFLLCTLPFAIYSLKYFSGILRAFAATAISMACVLIAVNKTRSVWLASAVLLLFALLFILSNKILKLQFISFFRRYIIAIVCYAVFSAAITLLLIQKDYSDFSLHVQKVQTMDDSGRFKIWRQTVSLIKQHPVLGVGPGNWKLHIKSKHSTFWQRPHNDFLWVCSESGVFAFIIYISLFAYMSYIFCKTALLNHPHNSFLGFSAFLSLIAYTIFAVFSFPKERMVHILFFAFLNTVALALMPSPSRQRCLKTWIPHFLLSLLVSANFLGIKRVSAEYKLKRALFFPFLSNKERIELISAINQTFYKYDPFSTPVSYHKGTLLITANQPQKAKTELLKAYALAPNHPFVMTRLANHFEIEGNRPKAMALYQKVIQKYPKHSEALINLAIIYYQKKEFDKCRPLLEHIAVENIKSNENLYRKYLTLIEMTQ